MFLAFLAALFLILAATACLALAGAVAYMVLVVIPAALKVTDNKPVGLDAASHEAPVCSATTKNTKDDVAVADKTSQHSGAVSDRTTCELTRLDSSAAAPCAFSVAVVSSLPANPETVNVMSAKEIAIDAGINYGTDCTASDDSSVDIDREKMDSELDDSMFFCSGVDSELLRAGDFDVDWELETIASVHSSSALDDTDYILGGESDESDSGVSFVASSSLKNEQQDAVSVCSSKPDEDDQSTEDETDEEEQQQQQQQQSVQLVIGATNLARLERIARAVAAAAVPAERGSRLSTPQTTLTATRTADTTAATVSSKPISPKRADVPSAERVAAAEPVTFAAVRSRVYDFKTSTRFVAQREANMVRAQAIREKSAMVKASRFH